ncbi:MAG TPA: hypothetical protein VJP85_10190 [Candidatus Baltobacteraceae bacterium]|nr:hypothetical protein [Candidatus Baltobacteraceae bacterium]
MKRRYKQGDWLRVPLGGGSDALGIIARMCRSRLFGYFFAVPSSHEPAHDELRGLRWQDAIAALLFGGAPLEEARWDVVATSLAFDPQAWPLPFFASRGAFGDTWTQVRYDPQTLQIVERRLIDAQNASSLPDARFAEAEDVERFLRARIAGETVASAHSVLEVRSPLEPQRLRAAANGGRVQFSTPLAAADLDRLAAFVDANPQTALRVHGFRHGFDASQLARFTLLRELILEVQDVQHAGALRDMQSLRTLRLGRMRINLQFLDALTNLQRLQLHGTRGSLEAVLQLPALESLLLESTEPLDFHALQSARSLQTLVLAHGRYDVRAIDALPHLRRLELRALDAYELPPPSRFASLEDLHLHALAHISDLQPIADAPALRRLRITAMPHLNVRDFEPIRRCAGLQTLNVEIGSRTKEREIYRLIKRGNT